MEFKNWPCWTKVAAAIGLVVFVLNWPSSSGEWAAWVQAVGTIGAVIGAIWVGNRGTQFAASLQIEKEEREVRRREEGCKAVVDNLIDTLGAAYQDIVNKPKEGFFIFWENYLEPHIRTAVSSLDRLPMQDLGCRERVVLVFAIQTNAKAFVYLINKDLEVIKTEKGFEELKEKISTDFIPQLNRFASQFNLAYK